MSAIIFCDHWTHMKYMYWFSWRIMYICFYWPVLSLETCGPYSWALAGNFYSVWCFWSTGWFWVSCLFLSANGSLASIPELLLSLALLFLNPTDSVFWSALPASPMPCCSPLSLPHTISFLLQHLLTPDFHWGNYFWISLLNNPYMQISESYLNIPLIPMSPFFMDYIICVAEQGLVLI